MVEPEEAVLNLEASRFVRDLTDDEKKRLLLKRGTNSAQSGKVNHIAHKKEISFLPILGGASVVGFARKNSDGSITIGKSSTDDARPFEIMYLGMDGKVIDFKGIIYPFQ